MKKWKTKVTAYKRAISKLEAGYNDDHFYGAVRARDALDKAINDAAAYVPYVPGQPAHTAKAIQSLEHERQALVSSTWLQAQERGRAANYQSGREQIAKLKEEEHEDQRPTAWMRR